MNYVPSLLASLVQWFTSNNFSICQKFTLSPPEVVRAGLERDAPLSYLPLFQTHCPTGLIDFTQTLKELSVKVPLKENVETRQRWNTLAGIVKKVRHESDLVSACE